MVLRRELEGRALVVSNAHESQRKKHCCRPESVVTNHDRARRHQCCGVSDEREEGIEREAREKLF